MRIISNFHDYYDSVQGYGFDPTVVYLRKTFKPETTLPHIFFHLSGLYYNQFNYHISTSGEIFFCGKRYRFVCFEHDEKIGKKRYFYRPKKLLAYVEKAYKKDIADISRRKRRRWGRDYKKNIKKFFDIKDDFESNVRFHEEFNSPIFVSYRGVNYGDNNIVVNPVLKDMNFQTVLNPYTTFQEIDMFLSGVMQSSENEMIKISDKIRKQKHGFDKTSFRPKMKK